MTNPRHECGPTSSELGGPRMTRHVDGVSDTDHSIPAPALHIIASSAPIHRLHPAGGLAWRRQRGLLSIADLRRAYRARRWARPGLIAALPEDLLPRWREVPR